jgi:ATP-dependent Zn protease
MAAKIDATIAKLIRTQEKRTFDVINKNKELMHKISKDLLKKEVLNREEFEKYFK